MKASSVTTFRLWTRFEAVRREVLAKCPEERLNKPLGHWAMPDDRRLPLALLGHTVGEIVRMTFEDVLATPGIGQKKIASLVDLLERTIEGEAAAEPASESGPAVPYRRSTSGDFRPELVSDSMWRMWCDRLEASGLGEVPLGRLSRSLLDLPTVMWKTPFQYYLGLSLNEVRSLKSHGEKRVNAVLELFHSLYGLLPERASETLTVNLCPRRISLMQQWISSRQSPPPISLEELQTRLIQPMLEQITADSSDSVGELAKRRLGIGKPPESVKGCANWMNVTRTRIYQLLDECARIAEVRWPDGRRLTPQLLPAIASPEGRQLLERFQGVFFPVEELAEANLAEGDLAEGDGRFHPANPQAGGELAAGHPSEELGDWDAPPGSEG